MPVTRPYSTSALEAQAHGLPRRAVLAGALGALASCAGPRGGPLDAVIPPSLRFTMADGAVLPARACWPSPGVRWRGVMLALHGFTDSRDGFELAGPAFAAAGYAVVAPDQRGFGATASRGQWPGTGRLIADAAAIAGTLRQQYPGLPLIVLGESMGGAVALCLAARPTPPADATVALAPAVWGWGQLDWRYAALLWAADSVAPDWRPNPGVVPEDIFASDNIEALRRMGRDPLTLPRPTVGMLRGLVDLMSAAQAAVPLLHGRVLVLGGRRDRIVPQAAAAAAWRKLPGSVRAGFYPNGYHLLLRDRDRALVMADVVAWLAAPEGWLPSGADVAASAWVAGGTWRGEVPETAWAPGRLAWPF